jgi:acyl-CoA dehydrogenase
MMTAILLVATLGAFGALGYRRAGRQSWLTTVGILAIASIVFDAVSPWLTGFLMLAFVVAASFGIDTIRRNYITEPVLRWFRRTLPALSDTEQAALDAGTVWWDAELFSGAPDWRRLLATSQPELTSEEQAFLDGPVETLCGMLDSWRIENERDLPPSVWAFLKEHRFFGMIIDKAYGGLGFSPYANSEIVMKIATRDPAAAVTVMVPNSLGPGELLQHYGTEAQKSHYLPRLASGEDVPCFALTSPVAGSDAGSMADSGVVCHGEWQGERVLGFRLNWDKRYITLAPVATLLGLAFKAYDPDHLLGDVEDLGITCALVPTNLPGVVTGRRHLPSGASFMNGPTQGHDVFIPLDAVIGGTGQVGHGWSMLVQSLAAGRAISLPAMGVAGTKVAAHASGAYSRVRKQFKMPIGYFEGIEEVLARLAGNTYRDDATRRLTITGLMVGERPSVLTAIAKAYLTESNRRAINDAMDVHGGKGIMQGPRNYLQTAYRILPIGITVEGANILTRSMIVFGQGAIRAHPFILEEMQCAQDKTSTDAVDRFDAALFSHVAFTVSNFVRTFVMGITGARFVRAPTDGPTAHYYRQLTRMSSAFALISDLVLMVLGGNFKFREKLSGRLADVLAHLYMASAVLKEFDDAGRPEEDLPLVNWAMRDSLFVIQDRLINVVRNFPAWWLRRPLRAVLFPLGLFYREPSDNLGKRAARILLSPGAARDRLTRGVYFTEDGLGLPELNFAFAAVNAAEPASRRLRAITHEVVLPSNHEALIAVAQATGDFSDEEAALVRRAQNAVANVVAVDDFAPGELRGSISSQEGSTGTSSEMDGPTESAAVDH